MSKDTKDTKVFMIFHDLVRTISLNIDNDIVSQLKS